MIKEVIMKPNEYFNWLKSLTFIHSGLNADYNITYKDDEKALYVSFQQTKGWFDWIMNILFIPALVMIPFMFNNSILHPVFIIIVIIQAVVFCYYLIKYFPKKPYKHMRDSWRVHFGMALIYGSIRDEVMAKVKEYIDKGVTVIYAGGWSQGGGPTQLFCEDCSYQFNIRPVLTTFGSLRVAWGKKSQMHIADSCAVGSHAYENGSDIVPHCPMKLWGFRDVLKEHIGEKFNIFKIFGTPKYHTAYGDESLYI